MRQGEIGLRSHLDQPRGGALELLRLEALGGKVEPVRLGGGGRDQLHGVVVESIDQDDETLGGVARVIVHHWDAVEHQRVERARDREIVGGGQRLLAQLTERKARDPPGGARHAQRAPLHR